MYLLVLLRIRTTINNNQNSSDYPKTLHTTNDSLVTSQISIAPQLTNVDIINFHLNNDNNKEISYLDIPVKEVIEQREANVNMMWNIIIVFIYIDKIKH